MVDPACQGRGWGAALLDAAAAHARGLGLRLLRLSARGGTTLPAFYAARGWTEVGVFPDALQLHPGEFRAEHWFQLALRPGTSRRVSGAAVTVPAWGTDWSRPAA